MSRGAKRVKEIPQDDVNDGRVTTAQRIDYDKVYNALKTGGGAVKFDGYKGRDTPKKKSQ